MPLLNRIVLSALQIASCLACLPLFAQSTPAGPGHPPGDWPMFGGTPGRNMVSPITGISLDFSLTRGKDGSEGKNVVWSRPLGSPTYSSPVVSGGRVLVGTNNQAKYRENVTGDHGILLCFDEHSGEFQWQLSRTKLDGGAINDWPEQGICSVPAVEGDRAWLVTNRCELVCVDMLGFRDGENDGVVTDEASQEAGDADVVWSLDMIAEHGVFPHNLASSSPVVVGDRVFLLTGNGVDEDSAVPAPEAPSFMAVDRNTGRVLWARNFPGDRIMDGQWSNPSVGVVNGKTQVYFAGGDGWLYALDPETGDSIWKFDCNPKDAVFDAGGTGSRNYMIATPVFFDNSVLIAVGQDPENGSGVGQLWRIDATRSGDVSPELGETGQPGKPNPDSAAIWNYGGLDADGSVTGEANSPVIARTLSTASVHSGLVFVTDLSGFVHCVDFATGKRKWAFDMMETVWGSTVVADGKVFVGNEAGMLVVFAAKGDAAEELARFDSNNYRSISSSPVFANGHLFLTDHSRLYRIRVTE